MRRLLVLVMCAASACTGGDDGGATCQDCLDAAGASDAGGDTADAGAVSAPCGSTDLLQEDFETADPGRLRWVPFNFGPGIPPTISGGRAVLSFADDGATGAPGFITSREYRLDESQVAIDAAGVSDVAGVQTLIYMSINGGRVGFRVAEGILEAERQDDPDAEVLSLGSAPFSPTAQRHWRMREAGDLVHFETSPDGDVWSELATTSSLKYARPGLLFFVLVESATSAGSMSIEGVNETGTLADSGWCPIDQLADDFDDPSRAIDWTVLSAGTGCTVAEVDGVLELANPMAGGSCGYRTALGQILTGGAVWVEAATPAGGEPDLTFALQLGVGGERIAFHHTKAAAGTKLQLLRLDPGEKPADAGAEVLEDIPFDAGLHRFWQFRDDGGALVLESSPDAADWTELHTIAEDLPVADVFVSLETTRPGGATVAFDNLRRLP